MNETVNERDYGLELNLMDLLMAYLQKWKLILVCVILSSAIALGITAFAITPLYQANATILVNNRTTTEDKESLTSADLNASIHLVKGYMILSESDVVLSAVADKLDNQYTTGQLRSYTSVKHIDQTVIFGIYITHPKPSEAARIANALAEAISVLGPEVIKGSSASTIDSARIPSTPSSPSYSRNLLLGVAAGLLVAVIYITVMFLKDTRIKDENDLTDMFDLPILGRIPDLDSEFTGKSYYGESENKE